jgi:hypothetical protein
VALTENMFNRLWNLQPHDGVHRRLPLIAVWNQISPVLPFLVVLPSTQHFPSDMLFPSPFQIKILYELIFSV